jgi:hypothetical protein
VEGDPGIPLEVGSLGRARSYGNEQTSVAEYGSDGVDSGSPVPRHRGQEDIAMGFSQEALSIGGELRLGTYEFGPLHAAEGNRSVCSAM